MKYNGYTNHLNHIEWRGCDVKSCILVFVRLKPHAHMQNALKRVNTIQHIGAIQREVARFGISDTEFIRRPWWGTTILRHTRVD